MESEPNERDAWVRDAERWICQINGIRQCKIDLDPDGEVTGVHVVAGMERDPRHVVRDVEGLLKARLGVAVFYKKIGVVQVVDNGREEPAPVAPPSEPEPPPAAGARGAVLEAVVLEEILAPRILCTGVGITAAERSLKAEVTLRAGGCEVHASEEGVNHAGGDLALIGRAAVAAVRQLVDEPVSLDLAEIRQAELAGVPVVLAAVELVEGRRAERLFGACCASPSRQQAAVYAVLDALNRRISLLTFKNGGRTRASAFR